MKKGDLDRNVSVMTGIPLSTVQVVTDTFLKQFVEELLRKREVRLPWLGLLRVHEGQNRVGIRLTKHIRLRLREESNMDKLGVDESTNVPDSAEKVAEDQDKCPKCGAKIERHGNIKVCPKCGTEPFEGC